MGRGPEQTDTSPKRTYRWPKDSMEVPLEIKNVTGL